MVICRFPFFPILSYFFPIRQRCRQHRHAPRSYTAPDAAMTRATTPCRARRCALPRPRGRGATAERANGCLACDAANPRSNVSNSLPRRRAPTSRSDVAPNPRPRRRARPQARKRSARDVPRPARPNAARAPKRADAAKPLVFGHGTALWHENRRGVRHDLEATWGFSSESLRERRSRRENAPRACQNAVSWPKIALSPARSNAKPT